MLSNRSRLICHSSFSEPACRRPIFSELHYNSHLCIRHALLRGQIRTPVFLPSASLPRGFAWKPLEITPGWGKGVNLPLTSAPVLLSGMNLLSWSEVWGANVTHLCQLYQLSAFSFLMVTDVLQTFRLLASVGEYQLGSHSCPSEREQSNQPRHHGLRQIPRSLPLFGSWLVPRCTCPRPGISFNTLFNSPYFL